MLQNIDIMLRQVFLSEVDEILDETQVRFQAPDESWRTYVSNLTVNGESVNALNVFLIDVQENRDFRATGGQRRVIDGLVEEAASPRWLDCQYLITAWSAATPSETVEPSLAEHALLAKAVAALMASEPLDANAIFAPTPPPADFPPALLERPLATTVLPTDAPGNRAEFWNTVKSSWRLGAYVTVTVPVEPGFKPTGLEVTAVLADLGTREATDTADRVLSFGGTVIDAAGDIPEAVPGARVSLGSLAGLTYASTTTDADGRFRFGPLRTGSYRLRAAATGLGTVVRDITLPSGSGEYDLTFA